MNLAIEVVNSLELDEESAIVFAGLAMAFLQSPQSSKETFIDDELQPPVGEKGTAKLIDRSSHVRQNKANRKQVEKAITHNQPNAIE